MVSVETQLSLEADEEAVVAALGEFGGRLVRDETTAGLYWLILHPSSAPDETFYVRLAWGSYPGAAPSVRFSNGIGGSWDVARAWPIIPGYRAGPAGPFDICQSFTAEGFALHPDWQTGPTAWRSTGNPFLWVVNRLQFDLNNRYGGRHP
jgi:hypothetical protein